MWLSIALFFPYVYLYGLVWPVVYAQGSADFSSMGQWLFAQPMCVRADAAGQG